MSETAPDAATLLDEAGAPTEWVPFDHRPRTVGRMTVGMAAHGDWQLRMLRVEGAGAVPGVMLTGWAVTAAGREDVLLTPVAGGVDICVPDEDGHELHSELRVLVPFDAVVDTARSDLPNGAVQVVPHVTVRDVPAGYPVIVAVRRGPEPPPTPQMREVPVDGQGKPLRIHQTGSLIPEIELAPADSGHEITVRWPDRTREVVALPG